MAANLHPLSAVLEYGWHMCHAEKVSAISKLKLPDLQSVVASLDPHCSSYVA